MKFDMIAAGVGGQGILSIAFVIDNAALEEGLHFKQSEVHGMAQRGGAVVSHLRLSDREIFSDLTPRGKADLILSMEPLEALRYLPFLAPDGWLLTSINSVVNIPDYPCENELLAKIQAVKNHTLVNSADLAREAGSRRTQNMVMLGTASYLLPLENKSLEKYIEVRFRAKGKRVLKANISAFRAGAKAGAFYRAILDAGMKPADAVAVATRVRANDYKEEDIKGWIDLCEREGSDSLRNWLHSRSGLLPVGAGLRQQLSGLDLRTAKDEDFELAAATVHSQG